MQAWPSQEAPFAGPLLAGEALAEPLHTERSSPVVAGTVLAHEPSSQPHDSPPPAPRSVRHP